MTKLQEIPEEVLKNFPNARWVEARDNNGGCFKKRILLAELKGRVMCVASCNHNELLSGEQFSICHWDEFREIQEPKKIPYTAETFPMWAVWIRDKKWDKGLRYSIYSIKPEGISFGGCLISYSCVNDYEIAGMDGVWKPFYTTDIL